MRSPDRYEKFLIMASKKQYDISEEIVTALVNNASGAEAYLLSLFQMSQKRVSISVERKNSDLMWTVRIDHVDGNIFFGRGPTMMVALQQLIENV